MADFTTFTVNMENLLIVTHAVPVQRVRPRVPQQLELDTIKGPEGEDFALVSETCFLNRDLRWMPEGEENLDFHQSSFITYVKHGHEAGIYTIGSFVERGTPLVFERMSMKNAYAADFDISLAYDPEQQSYGHYYCEVLSSKGDTLVEIQSDGTKPGFSTPFKSAEEMVHFITARSVNYCVLIGGAIGKMRVEHEEMTPAGGDLLAGEFEFWENLGILREEEFEQPYSVLIQPNLTVTMHKPEIIE